MRERTALGKVKASKIAKITRRKPKKKCCRSKKRCLNCPVVIMRMRRAEDAGLKGKDLSKALKKARAA